ncbi:epiplakin [Pseudophryne corroboree]|uniref:epiplakin n=1 Tax=Pseudophryne corroboree TaxID=495146 RepID=UPI003081736E
MERKTTRTVKHTMGKVEFHGVQSHHSSHTTVVHTSHTVSSQSHHVSTKHMVESSSHHETSHINGAIGHHETLQAIEPAKASPSIGGFLAAHTKEKVGIYQALQKKLVSEKVATALLEAQAATGNIINPTTNQTLTVEAAIQQGAAGPEYREKLIFASKAATGYKDKEETLSLFQAFKRGIVAKNDTVRFLEAQAATGGIIDHVSGHRVPLSEALKLNFVDEHMLKTLTEVSEFSKCYLDPNTKEESTYQELLSKCIKDSDSGSLLLPLQETLQGLRNTVTLEQLLKASIISQIQYDEVIQGKQTTQKVEELQEVQQYLHGLASIGGVYIKSTNEKVSLYQAMKKNFVPSDFAVALLEAQAASGFIVDPARNKTFSVTEAIQEGLVGLELKEKLLTAERAVTGFNDPYTGEKISLFQAIKKELIAKNLGINLLEVQVATGGIIDPVHSFHVPLEVAYKRGLLDEDTAKIISDVGGFMDPNTNNLVTYQELRKHCTIDPDSKIYFLPLELTFNGLRGKVTSDELLHSLIIDKTTYENLQQGKSSVQDVAEQGKVRQYLQGTGCIAGVAVVSTNERKSIYQAMKEHFLMPGTSIALLEAQAATGYLIDPAKNLKFSVDEAVKNGLIGPEFYEKLLSAQKAATGYSDPLSGETLSLFQAIQKGFVMKDHGIHLLEVQLATGGIIDPSKKHRVPEEVAYTRGCFDQEINNSLLSPTEDIKGFFDPNSKENLTYRQLLERCLVDSHTGLYLIPVFDNTQDALKAPHSFIDFKTKVTLDGTKLTLTSGKFKGQLVSLWKLLFSEYFTIELRESLFKQYISGSLSVEELSSKVDETIKQLVSSTKITFAGLRESVTPGQLLDSEIIDKDLFEKLQQGEASANDVVNIDTVKKYLEGTGSIGGLILTDTQEKMSIYQAKRKGFLRPGTSLILLEAQAATGFIIDPVENKKYSVAEAMKSKVIGPEFYEKLLSAEKSVTGYKDPYTEERISLFQAMNKGLIVEEHGIRLLEAQIATGGIIDPINSHRIPVEVAYKRGYFDKKMNVILSDPSDDTKGFFDPNTNENLTYLQLKEKCISEPSTKLCLLPLISTKRQLNIISSIKDSFLNLEIYVRYGRFRGQTVSAWVLINSEYFNEWRRREVLEHYRLKKITLEQIIILIEEEIKKWTEIRVPALREQVNIYNLLEYDIIDKEQFEQVLEGKLKAEDVLKMEKVQRYLHSSGVLGGILILPSNQRISFYEAAKKNILLPSTILPLLEAQAATGHIIHPVNNQKLSVNEALKAAVIDPQIYDRLSSAEQAVTGYQDPFSGKKISLYQAMKKGLVEEKHAKLLLDAQLATGGVIDPIHSIHLPDSVAKKFGYLNEEVLESLSHPTDDAKSFYDPNTKEKVTYSELIGRSQKDESTGIYLLPLPQDFAEVPGQEMYSDEVIRQTFKNTRIEERNTTVWNLIHSGFFTEEQRYEILEKYKSKKVTLEVLITEILQIVKKKETMNTHISFQGLRGNVPVVRLLDLGIITQKTFEELVQGLISIEEVSQLENVKKCLQGTGNITGVFLPSTKEKISIYQAMKRDLILHANGLMLLEAQAATGFIVDPIKNENHTVDSAVKAGVIGPELHEKLLIAESAVTGYPDPYTGNKLSLGQAIHKELIPQKEGIPLLQAQLASGGIIDPIHCHYVPLQLAYKLGFLDEEISKQTNELKIYFDPNTKEKLSYQQLKEKCYTDPDTSSLFLSLSESPAFYAEGHLIDVLKSTTINTVNAGRFKGQTVSVWELLNSEYISFDKLKELLLKYKNSSSEVLKEIIKTVTVFIEETEASSTKIKFKGLRKQVSASDLFKSEVIDKQTLDELNLGKKTIVEVTEMHSVKQYLQGTNCIAGVLLQSTNTKMSIYEAMLKRILRPGTALVLLEAQAATGFIVDPLKNEKLSVEEALTHGLIGLDILAKLLSAEQAVTGYTDPYTGVKISLFQAMQKELIVQCHGIRLLEAQIATGGIIDPVHSHRVPVEVAYKRGYFNEEMNKILSDPSDDTKGFFDPNTHENLTYLQLVERCVQDPETGLYLLQVVNKGDDYFFITEPMKLDLKSRNITMQFGKFANQTVSIWEILTSHYVTDLKKRELVKLYKMGVLTIEQLTSNLTTLIEEYETTSSSLKFKGIRGEVSATDLYNADIIDKKTMDDLRKGTQSVETVSQMESVKRYLEGTSRIAGIISLPNNEILSIYEAIKRSIIPRDIGVILLEAQVATGFLIDPSKNQTFSFTEALSAGVVSIDVQEQLEIAEKAVSGFIDPKSGNKISLFQAIKKGIIDREQGIALLDAQLATGGIVDPVHGHRLPLQVAYRKGYLDEDVYIMISNALNEKKEFVDPNTHERLTYKSLLERCVKDPKTGLYLLQVAEKRDDYFYIDEPTKLLLTSTMVKMNEGRFKGHEVCLWDLLCSTYISEEMRKDLIKNYKTKTSLTLREIINVILSTIEEKEKGQNDIWFQGLRKQVTAVELFDAGIINRETLENLIQKKQTVSEISKIHSVKRYLEGTSCIAGLLIPSKQDPTKKETISIFDAMQRRLLRPGTALVLLEAQAATGFVIDPIKKRKLSVFEALTDGLIGHEIYPKLLSAEKGVTGYADPYTGEKISLFQAMQKDLIVREHGIRLLEAQIATGGIIDPVQSLRVPMEVAYKRGYFAEEMSQSLLDPTDDTKGFFDPNTHENLTYLQLLQRCIQDPDSEFYLLELKDQKFSFSQIQNKLQSRVIQVSTGEFQGQSISIWELIYSKYISVEKREELLKQYESGSLSIEEIISIMIKVITETEGAVLEVDAKGPQSQDSSVQMSLKAEKLKVSVGDFKGESLSLWELLNSHYFSEEERKEVLEKVKSGTMTTQEIITFVTTVITETEAKKTKWVSQNTAVTVEQPIEDHSINYDEIQKALQSINIHIRKGEYAGQQVSVWELLHSKYIPDPTKHDLLRDYRSTVQGIMQLVIRSVKEIKLSNQSTLKTEYHLTEEVYNSLQVTQTEVNVGELKGQKHSVWYLLNSRYISEEKRRELLERLKSGTISMDELIKVIITIIEETEQRSKTLKFKGLRRQITATELLTSDIIDQKTLTELAQGTKTVQEVTQMDNVKRYLEGTSCIGGVLVPALKDPSKKDKMSIYNAMLKKILTPGTALCLLEAQAATGFIIDPLANEKLSVDEAASTGIIGQELKLKLLSAERAVTGYIDPYTGDKISLFQAMQKDLIVKDHGVRLLEAQIATGGIIDPVHSHRVPVEVAYKRGYFDEEMNQILSDPTDDTKGFFDPNTHENLTYLQLLNRCIQDPDTGLCMLDMKDKKALPAGKTPGITLKTQTVQVTVGQYKGQNISIWDLLNSHYFTEEEEKRQLLLKQHKSGTITTDELIRVIITTIEEWEKRESHLNQNISEEKQKNLLQSKLIEITKGKLQGQNLSVWDLLHSEYITQIKKEEILQKYSSGIWDLEEIIRIITIIFTETEETKDTIEIVEVDHTFSIPQSEDLVAGDEEQRNALSVFTVHDEFEGFQGMRVSLWEILNSKYVSEDTRNAQLIKHQATVEKLKQTILKCIEDPEIKTDEEIQQQLKLKLSEVTAGEFKGQNVSIWFLLHSTYITEEKRKELLEKYKSGTLTSEEMLKILITIIEETEKTHNLTFTGLRQQVTATELLQSEIIDQATLNELTQGSRTVEEVTQLDSVKRYLEGTSCIAGVFVPSKKDPSQREKLTIYDAMLKRILRPGTALILLEAQAATGFVIDPIQNKKLSVEEALPAGLIGPEIYEKLLSAEKGVTGYNDPYTGGKISLFQAMKKDLIVKEHGIRLLEAQIATGGIIDPVQSHRVPVKVAYKRGYFDEEMNQILSDPTDDTKGFFDPNTHENLTYLQLLQRCIQDPDTGLCMLEVNVNKLPSSEISIKTILESKIVRVTQGHLEGKEVSVWELLNSVYISFEKREELLKKYKTGTLSINDLITVVTKIIHETEESGSTNEDAQVQTLLQTEKIEVHVGDFKGEKASLWELLNSHYISEEKRKELLRNIKSGTITVQEVITILITIINETENKKIEDDVSVPVQQPVEVDPSVQDDEIKKALQSINISVRNGQYAGQEVSVWNLLHSRYIQEEKRQELLGNYKLTVQDIIGLVVQSVEEAERQNSKNLLATEYNVTEEVYNSLLLAQSEVTIGDLKGQKYSVWYLLNSKYISEEKRQELLERLKLGTISIDEIIKTITTIIEETEERSKTLKFKGLRRQITATELLTSDIIDQKTMTELAQGTKTVQEVTQMDNVKRYLEGTSCIAGVLVPALKDPSKKDKMSIYKAMIKNILTRGTALCLLEAQAATGFIIDPLTNEKLSVDEAASTGIIGQELKLKLLSAERAVTGYIDPYTGDKISLFQAMQKDLIVKDHGVRLLEAQIATGGIIDPVHSHRVPVEVAYKRGYFDEEMNQILSDPTDDTKGFFDPNTHENLTYLQLLNRCIRDPDTGLCLLDMKDKKALPADKTLDVTLKTQTVQVTVGQYKGQNISIWDLLNSHYFTEEEEKRQLLLKQHKSGTITTEELTTIIITTIEEWEQRKNNINLLKTKLIEITNGKFQGNNLSVWDLLHSEYITESKKEEILQKYFSGIWDLEEIIRIITVIISEETVSMPRPPENIDTDEFNKALNAIALSIKTSRFQEQKVSLWEILHSNYISEDRRREQLKKHQATVEKLKKIIRVLIEDSEMKTDEQIQQQLELKLTEVTVGELKGQNVSVWFLLHSTYITEEKRKELLEKYKSGTLTSEDIFKIIITIIEETEKSRSLKFEGLRQQVTAAELLQSEIIDQATLNELTQGTRTVEEVTQLDSVKRYLEGTSCIAGVFVPSKKDPSQREKLTIYDAMLKRILRPGTALILLEAQAATGFVIDPIQNKKLSVEEALPSGLIGPEIYEKLLSAEKGVTGYNDPYTGGKISLFQAMKKDLIVKEHGIRLLEAQIATGGIIDPVQSHRVPVEVAYKRGYFDEEMNQILSDPTDDTKGFFDPNTRENLTYLQLLQKCIRDTDTGLCMLEVNVNKLPSSEISIKTILESKIVRVTQGHLEGKEVSVWELLNSVYISSEKREELLKKYKTANLSINDLITVVTKIIHETEESGSTNEDAQVQTLLQTEKIEVHVGDFKGEKASLWELLNSHYISEEKRKELLRNIKSGTITVQDVITILITIINETENKKNEYDVSVPVQQPVEVDPSLQDDEIKKALQSINISVRNGQYAGQEVSVWNLLHSRYIQEEKRQELLGNYKLTVQDIIGLVVQSVEEAERQNSKNLLATEYNVTEEVYNSLLLAQSEVTIGDLKGQKYSVWYLLNSKYISEEKRQELLERLKLGTISIDEIIKTITTIIEETEERSKTLKFKGLRRQITATELLTSDIIDQKTMTELAQGTKTVQEVTQMDNVKRYLEGTSCIAGVLVPALKDPSKKDKMSIYKAMIKNILTRGTALCLLEAQAATGFIIDPLTNEKLSVDEAASTGIIGQELKLKLLSAERAVTGYIDPYTGDKISLFQAMQKDLIVKDHGIRLLEAQIATGGIIDPVHSHRVPVEVAYKRGYFDEEMNQILSDPTDDTKGFFDPNTHENLTYLQLLNRCIRDPDTGLCLLDMKDKKALPADKTLDVTLKTQTVQVTVGQYKGQNISIWDLLNSHYFTEEEEKRQLLLKQHKSGTITTEELTTIIITTIEEWEQRKNNINLLKTKLIEITNGKFQGNNLSVWDLLHSEYITESKKEEILQKYFSGIWDLEEIIRIITVIISEETVSMPRPPENIDTDEFNKALNAIALSIKTSRFQEQKVSLWEILHSNYISEDRRREQLKKHQATVEKLKKIIRVLIEDSEMKTDEQIQQQLELKLTEVTVGELKGQNVSVWFLLHSTYITEEKRKELLEKYKSGTLTSEDIFKIIITIIEETEKSHSLKFEGLRQQVTAAELLQSEIIDQTTLNELTQGSRTVEEVTQLDSVKRYLEGTSCIAGVFVPSKKDPSQREKLTIYDAMLKRILKPGTALILLEAQAATGFVIDPIQNKKLSVEEALLAGLIGPKIYEKLLSAEKGVTGYNDPYTGGKISLFQAMKKDLIVKEHGIRLLEAQIATGGIIDPVQSHRVPVEVAYKRGYFDKEMNQILSDPTDDTKGFFDPNTHENLTYLQLLQRCIQDPDTGLCMLEMKDSTQTSTHEEQKYKSILQSKTVQVAAGEFQGKDISVWDLLYSQYISVEKQKELLKRFHSGSLTIEELITIIITIITEKAKPSPSSIKRSFQSVKIDISIGSFHEKSMSLWDLLHSKYIPDDKREELLEKFQSGTLTIEEIISIVLSVIQKSEQTRHEVIVPVVNAPSVSSEADRWPPEDQLQKALQAIPSDLSAKQSQQESASVWDLLHSEGLSEGKKNELLQMYKCSVREVMSACTSIIQGSTGEASTVETILIDEAKQKTLQDTMTEISVGHFKGQKLSVWDLLHSEIIMPEKRKDILLAYIAGTLTVKDIITMIFTILAEIEERSSTLKFKGLRRQVTATELLSSEIIDQKTLNELSQGSKTLEEVTQMDNVKRYLEGTGCIAGVFVPTKKDPSKKEKMSIYQAMWKQVLRPGTALVLLEAQAATGFIIDPINNKKLSVDEAVSAGVIGKELQPKLLSAERAVTGYNDPYTGEKISLFQAMNKNLIVKEHGIRLLEAQIATGGIIDPLHSHRVPVEVAYKRGYFDEEINQVLSDPSDDTKGFFDPNTHENLTYLQLLKRGIQDPDTGLCMLEVKDSGSPLFQIDQAKRNTLELLTVDIKIGQYQGQKISLWEILSSHHLADVEKERQELMTKYKSGSISVENLTTSIVSLIEQLEKRSATIISQPVPEDTEQAKKRAQTQNFFQSVEVEVGHLKGHKTSLWQLLNSAQITSEKRKELLEGFEAGSFALEDVIKSIQQIVMHSSPEPSVLEYPDAIRNSLQAFSVDISSNEFTGQNTSLWDILHSKTITKDTWRQLLKKYYLSIEGVVMMLKGSLHKADLPVAVKADTATFLKSVKVQVNIGEFKLEGKEHSLWELLHTKYVTDAKITELLEKFESKTITWEEIFNVITTIIKETEEKSRNLKFKGLRQQVSASELLQSKIIDLSTLLELIHGTKTLSEVAEMESVRRYLEGTSCVAGVLISSKTDSTKKEKMSIYDAMLKNVLRPGTALVLLEAQAATGFIIDPIQNTKLTVDEAVANRVVGHELHQKLLSAEKAVTSYTDPTTSLKISLFQAIQKDLIVKDHGIRLLEAQIATGGIIDPVHSHRIPVEVAYTRGYFDEGMNQILSDPSDDTKGFFDPNTHENLTYLQLLQRCVQDPDTGLLMLEVAKK